MKPTHYYTAEALGLTPDEAADPALDVPVDVDVEELCRRLETGEAADLEALASTPEWDDPGQPDPLADLMAEVAP